MKVIGLDVGEKRIGVAQADSATRIAVPVGFILADGTEWEKLRQFSARFNTSLFVVGLPRSNEGNETAQSQYARGFAQRLVVEIPGAKVQFQDESLTSVVAEERLKARKKNYDKGEIDAEAAAIILQDFLEGLGGDGSVNISNKVSVNVSIEDGAKKKYKNAIIMLLVFVVYYSFVIIG